MAAKLCDILQNVAYMLQPHALCRERNRFHLIQTSTQCVQWNLTKKIIHCCINTTKCTKFKVINNIRVLACYFYAHKICLRQAQKYMYLFPFLTLLHSSLYTHTDTRTHTINNMNGSLTHTHTHTHIHAHIQQQQ